MLHKATLRKICATSQCLSLELLISPRKDPVFFRPKLQLSHVPLHWLRMPNRLVIRLEDERRKFKARVENVEKETTSFKTGVRLTNMFIAYPKCFS
jgi:hypothetical protein